jgi:hypothetical protein
MIHWRMAVHGSYQQLPAVVLAHTLQSTQLEHRHHRLFHASRDTLFYSDVVDRLSEL